MSNSNGLRKMGIFPMSSWSRDGAKSKYCQIPSQSKIPNPTKGKVYDVGNRSVVYASSVLIIFSVRFIGYEKTRAE